LQEKIEDPQVDPQKLDESTTTESEKTEDRKDVGERQTSIYPKTCGTDTVNYKEIMNIDSNSNSAMGNEETAEASPSQDENASNSKNEIQVMEVQDEVKIDAESDKIEDGNSSNRVGDVSIEEVRKVFLSSYSFYRCLSPSRKHTDDCLSLTHLFVQ